MNLEVAKRVAAPVVDTWLATRLHPEQPPFSGGVLDWPNWTRQALEVMNSEDQAALAFLREELRHG